MESYEECRTEQHLQLDPLSQGNDATAMQQVGVTVRHATDYELHIFYLQPEELCGFFKASMVRVMRTPVT